VHLVAPGPGLTPAAGLDELLEAAHIALDTPIKDTQLVGHVLDEPFGVDVHLGSDPSGGVVEAVEGDDPGVIRAVVRVPRDALVGSLLGDSGIDPEGFVESVADRLGILDRRVKGDMRRFKEFIESRDGQETGAWRGEVLKYNKNKN